MTHHSTTFFRLGLAVLWGGAGIVAGPPAFGQSSRVISVEEHWELQLGQPDIDRSAPQTTMVMSPVGDLSGKHFLFTLNHWSAPDYAPGGMEVQLWEGDALAQENASNESAAFETSDETVSWVQRLSLDGSTLK